MRCQELCATLAEQPPKALMATSRLNILICQYHLGYTQLIPERALPLLGHLPAGAALACLGLSLLAARKSDALATLKPVVLVLADERHSALDLPTVPTFVGLHDDLAGCTVVESPDGALMSEVVATFLCSGSLTEQETKALISLSRRYLEKAAIMAGSCTLQSGPAQNSTDGSGKNALR